MEIKLVQKACIYCANLVKQTGFLKRGYRCTAYNKKIKHVQIADYDCAFYEAKTEKLEGEKA